MDEQLPKTVREAIPFLLARLDAENQAKLKSIPRDDLIMLHRFYGMGVRNLLGLWGKNTELLSDPEIEGMHPDDASMYIIEQMWDYLHSQDADNQS